MLNRCEQVMAQVCADFDATLAESTEPKTMSTYSCCTPRKWRSPTSSTPSGGVSSRRLRQDFVGQINRAGMRGRFWSPSYFAGSCGGPPLHIVKDYIADQKRPD
jgi:putative transposase